MLDEQSVKLPKLDTLTPIMRPDSVNVIKLALPAVARTLSNLSELPVSPEAASVIC